MEEDRFIAPGLSPEVLLPIPPESREMRVAAGLAYDGPDAAGIEEQEPLETNYDSSPELELLRTQQRYVLEDLMAGKTYTEAARNVGLSRRTVYRWVNRDPAFRAAMDAWRRRAERCAETRLAQGTEAAAATLTAAASRDWRAALALLKGRGFLPGPASPVALKAAAAAGDPMAQVIQIIQVMEALPPGKRSAFEVRLRELVLSFKEDKDEAGAADRATPKFQRDQLPAPAGPAAPAAAPAAVQARRVEPAPPAPPGWGDPADAEENW